MTRKTRCAISTALLGMLALSGQTFGQSVGQTLIPVEHFAASETMSAPSLSPDGKHLVYIGHVQAKPFIMAYDLTKKSVKPILSGESRQFTVSWCNFKNDERLLCSFRGQDYAAGRPYTITRLVALNIDGSKIKVLLQNDENNIAQTQDRILHWLPDDPRDVLISLDHDGDIYPSVFRLDVYGGGKRVIQQQRVPVLSWMTDRAGIVRFGYGFKSSETSGIYIARASADAPWKTIEKFHRYDDQTFSPLGFGVRPQTMLVSAPYQGRAAVWEFDLEERADAQLVFANDQADVDTTLDWPGDGHVFGFSYHTDKPQAHYIDELARRVDLTMRQARPGQVARIVDASRDGKTLLIMTFSDVLPPSYYLLEVTTGTFSALSSSNPHLTNVTLAPTKSVQISSGDVRVPGYLTVPAGKEAKNLPTVVLPHGGPYARDTWGYDPWVQLLASRGYAVLQINFRGSTGYGEAWFRAGWRGWGTVIHDDITTGARWLVKEGIADPARMCIVGGSYGGYAALLGVVKEPGLYRCAVSIAGVSDLNHLKLQERFFYGGAVSARESIGTDKDELREVSPLRHADRIKVPVLLIHGEADSTVLASHSTTMARELRKQKVPTELVLIEDADHYFVREDMRLTLYRKMVEFLEAHLSGS